jgi:hypothetical protein
MQCLLDIHKYALICQRSQQQQQQQQQPAAQTFKHIQGYSDFSG